MLKVSEKKKKKKQMQKENYKQSCRQFYLRLFALIINIVNKLSTHKRIANTRQ